MEKRAWVLLLIYLIPSHSQTHNTGDDAEGEGSNQYSGHIFHDAAFWQHFEQEVHAKSWNCKFLPDVLVDTIDKDATLYTNDSVFRNRRNGVLDLLNNITGWVIIVIGACKELADGTKGVYAEELQKFHMLKAFEDYVDHLDYFYKVASVMASRGHLVKALSQDSSRIHDIDKMDPVMMLGYSERFEDNVSTSVWDRCVDRHTRVNPHHQAHCIWHDCCKDTDDCVFCHDLRTEALLEMVCDKVSRRVQKSLGGRMTEDMWDVEEAYFTGLPKDWLQKAFEILRSLKETNVSLVND